MPSPALSGRSVSQELVALDVVLDEAVQERELEVDVAFVGRDSYRPDRGASPAAPMAARRLPMSTRRVTFSVRASTISNTRSPFVASCDGSSALV